VVSRESVRQILHAGGVRWQATKTWKASTDPDFVTKMRRVLDLYDGRVICADEFGALNLQPRPGRAWRPANPARLRATYRRIRGVRHMLAALDLGSGQVICRIRERKRWREFLAFLKSLRARWPGQKLYVIVDNFSPDKHSQVTGWAAGHKHRAGIPAHLRLVAELDRTPIRRLAVLHAQRHRPPHPRLARRDDRRLHALAQRSRPSPRPASPRTKSSAHGPVTRPTLHDEALSDLWSRACGRLCQVSRGAGQAGAAGVVIDVANDGGQRGAEFGGAWAWFAAVSGTRSRL
jgi:hypothetical protein